MKTTGNKKTKVYKSKTLNEFFEVKDSKEYKRTENNMLLAARIEDAMSAKGLNRVKFAKEMNVSPPVITKWLSGTHNFTSDTLFDIQDALGVCLINTTEPQNIQTITVYTLQVRTENQSVKPNPYSYFDGNFINLFSTSNLSHVKN